MAAALLVLILPAFSGCFGGGGDAFGPSAAGGEGDVPTLPDGFEIAGGGAVDRTPSQTVLSWSSVASRGSELAAATAGGSSPSPPTQTELRIPADARMRILFELDWSAGAHLVLQVDDADGATRCVSERAAGSVPVYCALAHEPPATEDRVWAVAVSSTLNQSEEHDPVVEIPFELRVTIEAIPAPSTTGSGHHAVIGLADSGINPYHQVFRDPSPQAYQHPSTYLAGYPADAVALNLSLDAPDMETALAADEAVWVSVEQGQLYWIPGTKIVGAIGLLGEDGGWPGIPPASRGDSCPPILDCVGHGTRVASRAVGTDMSLCDGCLVAEAQGPAPGTPWLASAPWVDVVVHEEISVESFDRALAERIASIKPLLVPGGNGMAGLLGVAGHPAHTWNMHATGAISVGGHDNGRLALWTGSMPHVAADACGTPVADHRSVDAVEPGLGTSFSAPYVAGGAGRILLEARTLLGDARVGAHDDMLAQGDAGPIERGPLEDGAFTIDELKRVLFTTADPRPTPHPHDGEACEASDPGNALTPSFVPWSDVPDEAPQYYFIGYGAVTPDTVEHAKRVLRGEEPMPERPVEDAFFALDQEVRKALVEVDP